MHHTAKKWTKTEPPKRILAIRLQAMGDMVITLPYLQHLRNSLPETTIIDFLTRDEVRDIPESLELFDHVYTIAGGRHFKKQLFYTLTLLPRLLFRKYDLVLDLQNNLLSRIVRKALIPHAWTEFDRYSPLPAGERNKITIENAGFGKSAAASKFTLKSRHDIEFLLKENGWNKNCALVVLNPAGAFVNRNWPTIYYIEFAELWLQQFPDTQFLILGIDKITPTAQTLKSALGGRLLNLVNKTTPSVAFAILQHVSFVLSEDSGLMHMSWVSGIPTLALFGSTRSDWARPLGNHTFFLDSSDMVCGQCMQEQCSLENDQKNRCMTRYTPSFVFQKALSLINNIADFKNAQDNEIIALAR